MQLALVEVLYTGRRLFRPLGSVLVISKFLKAVEVLREGGLFFKELVDLGEVSEFVEELPQEFWASKFFLAVENFDKFNLKLCSFDTRVLIANLEGSQLRWVDVKEETSEQLTEVLESFRGRLKWNGARATRKDTKRGAFAFTSLA